jgi:hypothetical protein
LAVGTRLTFAPVLLAIWIAPLLGAGPWRDRIVLILVTGLGVAGGLLPSLVLFLQAPENFIFGNFEFPHLRLLDPDNARIQKTMRLSAKLRYFFKDIVPPSLPLYVAYALLGIGPAWRWIRKKDGGSLGTALVMIALPFALAGCFAPSRYQYQHYFGVTCLLALGVAFGLQQRPHFTLGLAGAVLISAVLAFTATDKKQRFVIKFEPPQNWFAQKALRIGNEIKQHAPHGPILTLAPAWPIEAGLTIYPEFATAPFGWRSAPFASREVRKKSHLIAPEDLTRLLSERRPTAILTGVEDDDLEEPFIEWAKEQGWRRVGLSKQRELWLPN